MPDANLVWSGDLNLSATGDVAMVTGTVQGQQRVLRRLLTNLADYTWQPLYGGGLGRFVGEVAAQRTIEGAIRSQLFKEAAVSQTPHPAISTALLSDGSIFVNIKYLDAASAATQLLTFSVGV